VLATVETADEKLLKGVSVASTYSGRAGRLWLLQEQRDTSPGARWGYGTDRIARFRPCHRPSP